MKIRTLIIPLLGALVLSNLLPAQEPVAPEPASQEPVAIESSLPQPQPPSFARAVQTPSVPAALRQSRRYPVQATPPPTDSNSPAAFRIFELKYADATALAHLMGSLFRANTHIDERLNRLVVSATPKQLESIERLISEMDVADGQASTPQKIRDFVYRIYMFEIPSGGRNMKSFAIRLQISGLVSSQELLDATGDEDLQITEFVQVRESLEDQKVSSEVLIEGKADSNESLKRVVDKLGESRIMELKWDDDETFTDEIDAAQYTRLPDQMQKHIAKFLGGDIQTVGYWFGNLSVPGAVVAPIGPWKLRLTLDAESDGMLELTVDIELPSQVPSARVPTGRMRGQDILSNTITAKIGKPIIIGYNRESYGTRRMGAMVIIPEADPFQPNPAETKTF
jgi:hypothetical protein